MKRTIGFLMFVTGLGLFTAYILKDISFWWIILSGILIDFGLHFFIDSIVDEKIDIIKKENNLDDRLDEIDYEIKEIKKHFNPKISWDENGKELHFDERIGWY